MNPLTGAFGLLLIFGLYQAGPTWGGAAVLALSFFALAPFLRRR